MALLAEKTTSGLECEMKEMSQADFGCLVIKVVEMPGLLSCRTEFGPSQPFEGARITGSLHMTIQAAAIARDSAAVFAWRVSPLQEYWWCTERALDWGAGGGPDLIVDDGGDATLLIHEGVKAEELFEKNGTLLFPVINVNDSVTKSKFDNLYGCRHSLPDGLMRATDVMIAGYGDVGKGFSPALKQAGARVIGTQIDPICTLQALMEGPQVLTLEDVVSAVMIAGKVAVVAGYGDVVKGCAAALKQAGAIIIIIIIIVQVIMMVIMMMMSCSFTNQGIAQLELWKEGTIRKYEKKVYALPKHLDEKVAALHLGKPEARLTKLSKDQADYISVPVEGPYKPAHYRY